jgi:hypothetical protein
MAVQTQKRPIAKESQKTRRAREKLKKRFVEHDEAITEQALEQKTIEIHRWIARQAAQRVVLRSKNISLFDENQNTAKLSRRIEELAAKVSSHFSSPSSTLKERNIEIK